MKTELVTVSDKATVQAFLRSLRTKKTRETYVLALKAICKGAPEQFLDVARQDKAKAENFLLDWIYEGQHNYSGSTIRTWLAGDSTACVNGNQINFGVIQK